MVNITTFAEYIHPAMDDPIADLCLAAAKNKVARLDIPEPSEDDAEYELFVYALAAYWYDNRGLVSIGATTDEVTAMINSFTLSLRGAKNAT